MKNLFTPKRIFLLFGVILALVCIFVGGFLFAFNRVFPNGFGMIPQDCALVKRDISGHVFDTNGKPIANATVDIQNTFTTGFEAGKVNLTLSTDVDGRFVKCDVPVFACDVLRFRIAAQGHNDKLMTFFAAAEYYKGALDIDPDGYGKQLPNSEQSALPVLPRQITVTLP